MVFYSVDVLQGINIGDPLIFSSGLSSVAIFVPFFLVVCNIGENVTISFDKINESIYDIAWYECPVNLQKYLIPMIMASEKPLHIHVFGKYECCRDTFKEVIYQITWLISSSGQK